VQRPRTTHRQLLAAAAAVLGLASAVVAGCGGGDHETAVPAEGFDSAYCNTARHWAVRELDPLDDSDPAAVATYWNEYLIFVETSLEQAPPAIRGAHIVHTRAVRTLITPVLEKYHFDFKRIEADGSPSEQAVLGEPPPDVAKAQARIDAYRNRVCGYGGSPPAADVAFKASSATKPYCAAGAAQRNGLEKVASSGFDPATFRSYVTSDSFLQSLDDQDAKAPPEIAADVKADNEWVRTRKLKVLEAFDYDLRRLLLEGSADDLAVFTYFDPAIIRQDSRVEAYQQLCTG
jgi:hypothetical protein